MKNACWCLPEGGSAGCCPDPGDRPISYEWQVAESFQKNSLTLTDEILFEPAGCDPWSENEELYPGIVECDAFPEADNADAVCGFIYPEDDTNCGGLDGEF